MARGRSLDGVPPAQSARREKGLSLTTNAAANGASQLYLVVCTLLVMPYFLRRMGVETYGLIGFFALMTAWFQILDAGLSLTLSRESARFRAGAIDAPTLRGLMSVLEVIFVLVAGLGAAAIAASAHVIAAHWLRANHLSTTDVGRAVLLMGLTVPLQWMTGLYRGAINGFERQVWLAGFNMVMTTLRFAGAAVAITLLAPTPWNFFCSQLAVSILELAVLAVMARRVLPPVEGRLRRLPQWREIRGLLKFSGSLAFAVVVWVLVTQIDKLILSRMLSLAEYGVYALAVLAAGAILALSGPVSQALLPRLAKLAAEGAEAEVVQLYRAATQAVCLLAAPCALVLAFFSGQVIWAWTGDARTAAAAGPILTAYALGNGIMTIGAFAYYLQDARGDLRLHVIGNVVLVGLLVPAIALAAARFGAVGAGYAWLGVNTLYLLVWVPLVHRRLAGGLHGRWLGRDVLPILAAAAASAWALSRLVVWPRDRLEAAVLLAGVGAIVALAAACASSLARAWISLRIAPNATRGDLRRNMI